MARSGLYLFLRLSQANVQLEGLLTGRIEQRLLKLPDCLLNLGARVTIANSMILGCVWYLLLMWAGNDTFLSKLQRMVEQFVWAGRNRVFRDVVSLPKWEGGLGLINIKDQHRVMAGGVMVWVALNGHHPLRLILQGHIHQASARRWGTLDLSWIVTPCGHLKLGGSATWQNICRNWEGVRRRIQPRTPVNPQEWRALPLWRPHVNHRVHKEVHCNSAAQRLLRNAGLLTM